MMKKNLISIILLALLYAANSLANQVTSDKLAGAWITEVAGFTIEMTLWPDPRNPKKYQGYIYEATHDCLGAINGEVYNNGNTSVIAESSASRLDRKRHGINCAPDFPSGNSLHIHWVGVWSTIDNNILRSTPQTNFSIRARLPRKPGEMRDAERYYVNQQMEAVFKRTDGPTDKFVQTANVSRVGGILRPSTGVFGSGDTTHVIVQAETSGTAESYLAAVVNHDTGTLYQMDANYRRVIVQGAASKETRAHRDLERIAAGKGFATDAEDRAAREWYNNISLIAPVMTAYLLNFDTRYASCLPENAKGLKLSREWVKTTTYEYGFPASHKAWGTETQQWWVKPEHYDTLKRVADFDSTRTGRNVSETFLNLLAQEKDRITVADISRATYQFMQQNPCDSEIVKQFEGNLFRLYESNRKELEKWRLQAGWD
ncbi:hypothetical protein [Arsukibacterium indicum]|uniref:Uncharacterized protein n=1 Tax=Arsukibacterium indicum TaxID=2848612 RepID=A0ABS6MQJ6_9GAMM|nr:hypothetical protein [Arsukibacterium indicum]MBV2131063.1 hypothetical protein [Arsukibacterium indicum]